MSEPSFLSMTISCHTLKALAHPILFWPRISFVANIKMAWDKARAAMGMPISESDGSTLFLLVSCLLL